MITGRAHLVTKIGTGKGKMFGLHAEWIVLNQGDIIM